MSLALIGLLGVAILILLMASGLNIAFCFAVVGFLGVFLLKGIEAALGTLGVTPYMWASHYVLMAIPLFVLMGYFAFHAGVSNDLYESAEKWFGHLPGGLALATIVACAGFAATSGSSLAVSGAMGAVAIPEMEKRGYDKALSAGVVAAAGTMGILIPPSLCMIIYGTICEVSVARLFMAGILPGLLEAISYIAIVVVKVKINPKLAPRASKFPLGVRVRSLKGTWMMISLFIFLMGGIFAGVFTPTEAAAMGAVGAFVFAVYRKQLTKKVIVDSLRESGKTTCMIFMLYIGAMIFMTFLAFTRLPFDIANWVSTLPLSPKAILIAILIIYIPLGMFMDALSMIVLTLPIFFPIIKTLGFDPIWFGVLIVRMVEIALITPPVGLNVFILKGVADLPLYGIFRGIVPFVFMDFICVAILFIFPEISLFLPSLMGQG